MIKLKLVNQTYEYIGLQLIKNSHINTIEVVSVATPHSKKKGHNKIYCWRVGNERG